LPVQGYQWSIPLYFIVLFNGFAEVVDWKSMDRRHNKAELEVIAITYVIKAVKWYCLSWLDQID